MHAEDDVAALRRLADQRDPKRTEVLREDRDDIDAQGRASSLVTWSGVARSMILQARRQESAELPV